MIQNIEAIKELEREIEGKRESASKLVLDSAERTLKMARTDIIDISYVYAAIEALRYSSNHTVIRTKEKFQRILKVLMIKNYVSMLSIEVNINRESQKDEGKVSTVSLDIGRAFTDYQVEDDIVVPIAEGLYQRITKDDFAPFTDKFILVTLNGDLAISATNGKGYTVLVCNGNYKVFRQVNECYIDVITSTRYSKSELNVLAKKIDPHAKFKLYKAYLYSASGSRQHKFFCVDVTKEDNRNEMIDRISNHALSIMKDEINQMICSVKDKQVAVLKRQSRLGQLLTSSVNFGEVDSWVYIDVPVTTSHGETQDGACWGNARELQTSIFLLTGIWVIEKVLAGQFTQARPDGFKTGIIWEREEDFLQRLRVMYETYPDHIVRCGIAKDKTPMIIADSNVVKFKSLYDICNMNLEILAFATNSEVYTSRQILNKILYAGGEEAVRYITKRMFKYVQELFSDIFETEKRIPTPGEVYGAYESDLVSKLDPDKIYETVAFLNKKVQNTVKTIENALNKMRFPVDGDYNHIVPDQSEVLAGAGRENAVIKYGEAYIPFAEKYFTDTLSDEICSILAKAGDKFTDDERVKIADGYIKDHMKEVRVMMIKHPSVGLEEYYLLRPLTLKEIHERINSLNIPFSIKRTLHNDYNSYKNGVSITPSTTYIMKQLAGLDYDFDSASYIYDQELISFVKGKTPRIINIIIEEEK